MKIIQNNNSNDKKILKLTKNLTLTYNQTSSEMILYNKDEEEEILLTQHNDNIVLVDKIDDNYFYSISCDKTIKLWNYKGDFISSIDEHSKEIMAIDIFDKKILSISLNDIIVLSDLNGNNIFSIEEKIDDVKKVNIWKDSIHILDNEQLNIYDKFTGSKIISFDNQKEFIDNFKRLNKNILTLSDYSISLWDERGKLIKNLTVLFSFEDIMPLEDNLIAVIDSSNQIFILDDQGNILSEYKKGDIANDFKDLISASKKLMMEKVERSNINQFPHISNPVGTTVMNNSIDEIEKQDIDFSDPKFNKTMWDFFNRPLFRPVKRLLKKEENKTKRFKKEIVSSIDLMEKDISEKQELLEKESKSKKTIISILIVFLLIGAGAGFVNKLLFSILILPLILIFVLVGKNTNIQNFKGHITKLTNEINTLKKLQLGCDDFIHELKIHRNSLIKQFPIVQDKKLFDGIKVNEMVTNLLNNDINNVAMNECGLIQEDIIHQDQKAIILNDWSLIQSNTNKVDNHNMHSFWGTGSGIIFATQFIQYIFLTKDKIDVFNTHYDFIKNKFIRKEAHAFYYKDVTNITKKEVDRKLMEDDDATPATEITLKVSSGDSIELTILNSDTLSKLSSSSVDNEQNEDKLNELEQVKKEIENDTTLSDEEKEEELEFLDAQISTLNSRECITQTKIDETNKVDSTIQNIRAQIKIHKQ